MTKASRQQRTVAGRTGATLMEVLIAILILGIGAVSVATLFPAAVIRSIRATQLTEATVLRRNAETMFEVRGWSAAFPEPATAGDPTTLGVIDPLGVRPELQTAANYQTHFGGDSTDGVPRDDGGATSLAEAEALAMLPDSWTTLFEVEGAAPDAVTPMDKIILPDRYQADLAAAKQLAISGNALVRALVTGADGLSSVSRVLTSANIDEALPELSLDVSGAPLPGAGYATLGGLRIETLDRRYTWMLTVRVPYDDGDTDTPPAVYPTAIVFYNRTFSADEEQIYGEDHTGTVSVAGDRVTLSLAAGDAQPALTQANFFYYINNGRWYRISSVENAGTLNPIIRANRALPPPGANPARIIFMRNIIDVFPMEVKP